MECLFTVSITEPVSLPTSVSSLSTVDVQKSNKNSSIWSDPSGSRASDVDLLRPAEFESEIWLKEKGSDHPNRIDNKDISERRRTQYLTYQIWQYIATLTLEVQPLKSSSPTAYGVVNCTANHPPTKVWIKL